MRKSIWVALAATLVLSSCFKTVETEIRIDGNPVVFSEKVEEYAEQTRAMGGHPIENVPGQVNKGLIPIGKSFGVWAWSHDGGTASKFTGLQNKSVMRGANEGEKAVYTYTPTATWPSKQLSFLAYYPHSASTDAAANGGMGTLAVANDGTTMTIPYSVPTIGEKHIDLMYARKGATPGYAPVELEFRHALSRMKFSARIDGFNAGDKLRVTGIKLVGATLTGTLTVPKDTDVAATWALGNAKGDITVADGSDERPDHILDRDLSEEMQSLITATGEITTAGDLIVLPQEVAKLSLEITTTLNGEEYKPYIIPLAAAPTMVMNFIYNYRIVFSPQSASVRVEVIPWNEGMNENAEFDGQHFLRVNKSHFEFESWESDKADGYKLEDILEIETDHPDGWRIDNIVCVPELGYGPYENRYNLSWHLDWMQLDGDVTTPNKTGSGTVPIHIGPYPAPAAPIREATFDVVAGNMTKKIHVYQVGGGYLAAPGVLGVGVETGKLTLGGSKEYKNSKVDFGAENEFGPIEDETVYSVYFRWGSMIATTSAGGHQSAFNTDHIVWAPAGFRGTATEADALAAARAEFTTFGSIPYRGWSQWVPDPNDPAALGDGMGDPCSYLGDWSIPVGGGENGGWNGGTFGNTNGQPLADYYVDWHEVGPGLPAGVVPKDKDWRMFIPFAGDRHSDGRPYNGQYHNMNHYTNYWSSTPFPYNSSQPDRGSILGFNTSSGHLSVLQHGFNNVGNPIRCVRKPEPDPFHLHASPGVIGYYAEGPNAGKLTLQGSSAYKGTDVEAASAAQFGPLSDYPVYVAYFKWGSLIALGSENRDKAFSKDDIIYGPDGYDLENLKNTIIDDKTGAAAWGTKDNMTIPYRSADGWATWPTNANAANVAAGLGDPCDYYFNMKEEFRDGGWLLPTGGGESPSIGRGHPWADNAGSPFGNVTFADWPLTNGANWVYRAEVTRGTFPNDGAVAGKGSEPDWSMFLPAAGGRDAFTGGFTSWSDGGAYWSSAYKWILDFNSDEVSSYNRYSTREEMGFPIRCVKEPEPEILAIHASPGVIGYYAEGPNKGKLTLQGSSAYKGTDVETASAAQFGPLSEYHVYVAYFKRGSLVPTNSVYSDKDFSAAEIVDWPGSPDFIGNIKNTIGTGKGQTAWNAIQYRTSGGWNLDESRGLGNACAYYFEDFRGGGWILPTADPWGGNVGTPFGSQYLGGWPRNHGAKWIARATVDPNLPHDGGVAGNGAGIQNWSMFLPAAGARGGAGKIAAAWGVEGRYWPSTTGTVDWGESMLYFTRSYLGTYNAFNSTPGAAFAIRCVRPTPPEVENLLLDLVLAPPGVIGIKQSDLINLRTGRKKADDPSIGLTLKGSSTYAGDGAFADESEFGPLENEPVYVVYFKWGSTVAVIGGPSGTPFHKEEIVWVPPGFDLDALIGQMSDTPQTPNAERTDWGKVPYATMDEYYLPTGGFNNGPSRAWPDNDGAAGLGDPCDYADRGGSKILPAGAITFDRTLFLPAAGVRAANEAGDMSIVGGSDGRGEYWARTGYNESNGDVLIFEEQVARPEGGSGRNYGTGLPIRCVR